MINKILQGDSIEVLKTLEDNSIDTVITDPPYGYSFMGKDWDKAVPSVEIWQECLRVLKPGAFMCVMSAPRSDVLSRMIVNIEDAGFRVDFSPIAWTFASGFPKALNIHKNLEKLIDKITEVAYNSKQWENLETASIAEELYLKLKTEAGLPMPLNGFVVVSAAPQTEAPRSSQVANTVASQSPEALAMLSPEYIVLKSVDTLGEQFLLSVSIVAKNTANQYQLQDVTITVPSSVIISECEQALRRIKADEAWKIGLGSSKSLKEQDINALCAELTEAWKHIILSQYSSLPNLDTNFQTDSVSATTVITTASIMERLIINTVDTLAKRLKEEIEPVRGSFGGAQMKPAVEVVIIAMKPLQRDDKAKMALDFEQLREMKAALCQ